MGSEKHVFDDYKEFIKLLNKNNVEYLIVGAYATMKHTNIARASKDIDFWIGTDEDNAKKCAAAIKEFCGLNINYKDLLTKEGVIYIGHAPNRIDIFNTQGKLNFNEAWTKKARDKFKGVKTQFISKEDLIN